MDSGHSVTVRIRDIKHFTSKWSNKKETNKCEKTSYITCPVQGVTRYNEHELGTIVNNGNIKQVDKKKLLGKLYACKRNKITTLINEYI